MDDLNTLANQRGRGLRVFRALIADDATDSNDLVNVRIPAYDPSRQFGPCHWAPRILNDGTPLWPNRNDQCLVALDENDQAEILNWWAEDPTSVDFRPQTIQLRPPVFGWTSNFTTSQQISTYTLPGLGGYPRGAYVHAFAQTVVRTPDAAWHGIEAQLSVPTMGPDGILVHKANFVHHNAAGPSVSVNVNGRFQIAAGAQQTIRFHVVPTTGNWNHYIMPDYSRMILLVIPA
jgi:hypothetical protein